nr:hypothetical protein Iba_chr14eCG11180 [Ipomoea batatas]
MEKSRDGRSWSQAVRFWSCRDSKERLGVCRHRKPQAGGSNLAELSNRSEPTCSLPFGEMGQENLNPIQPVMAPQPNGEAGLASGNGVLSRNEDGELADILR